MLKFPSLKTGAAVQYPAKRSTMFSNHVLSFLDGREQRYRLTSGPLHRWLIQLDLLEDDEINALEAFITDTQGSFADFIFTDPRDGKEYAHCYLKSDDLESMRSGGLRGRTELLIYEERTSI